MTILVPWFLCGLTLVFCACSGGGEAPPGDPGAWRSVLFSAAWTPQDTDAQGRFLHDFSYAGYRNGTAQFPDGGLLPVFDVTADTTGATDATASIQAALDAAAGAGGGIVHIPAGLYRCDGLLTVTQPGIILRGDGPDSTRLFFTRFAGMTDRNHISFRGSVANGAEYVLAADGAARSPSVLVADATGLAPGDDVALGWVVSDEFIAGHGMTGTWQAFNGTWQPFFRREVREVNMSANPHRVTLDVPLRYPASTRDSASLRVETGYLSEVGVESLGVANAVDWDDAWTEVRVHAIGFDGVEDGWMIDVKSFAPPGRSDHLQNGGVIVLRSKRVTVADVRMENAQNRGGGGSGYLFEISRVSEILTRDCVARNGRHNFIQNWGFGATGCVWLRCSSAGGLALFSSSLPGIGTLGYSEFHHSLATANLIDACSADDGWSAVNREQFSTGAGHTATQNVFWNTTGPGILRSRQYGWGYVIGTAPETTLITAVGNDGSEPEDWVEGAGLAASLAPPSLYEAQHEMRTGAPPESAGGG